MKRFESAFTGLLGRLVLAHGQAQEVAYQGDVTDVRMTRHLSLLQVDLGNLRQGGMNMATNMVKQNRRATRRT